MTRKEERSVTSLPFTPTKMNTNRTEAAAMPDLFSIPFTFVKYSGVNFSFLFLFNEFGNREKFLGKMKVGFD